MERHLALNETIEIETCNPCENATVLPTCELEAEIAKQEAEEEYTKSLSSFAYRLSESTEDTYKTDGVMTFDDLLRYFEHTRKKHIDSVDLTECRTVTALPERKESTEDSKLLPAVKADAKNFLSKAPTWFDFSKPTAEKSKKRVPLSAFAAVGVLAISLSLIVSASILVNHGESANNKLKRQITEVTERVAEMEGTLNLQKDSVAIREIAETKLGMIDEAYVRTEYLSVSGGDSVEAYPEGEETGVGLSALLSAIGIKK